MAKTLALGKRLPFGGGNPSHIARPPPPTLQQLFARTAPPAESSGEIANITDDEDENADKPDPYFQNRPAGSPVKQKWEQQQQDQSQRSPQNAFSSLQGDKLLPSQLVLSLPTDQCLCNPAVSVTNWLPEQHPTSCTIVHPCCS